MADLLTIPVASGVPVQEQTTTLDGRPFRFRFRWLGRIARWAFDLETDSGVSIVRCKGLVLGSDMLRQVRSNPAAPQGVLAVVDTLGAGLEPDLYTLGTRHRIVYLTADEDVTEATEAAAEGGGTPLNPPVDG